MGTHRFKGQREERASRTGPLAGADTHRLRQSGRGGKVQGYSTGQLRLPPSRRRRVSRLRRLIRAFLFSIFTLCLFGALFLAGLGGLTQWQLPTGSAAVGALDSARSMVATSSRKAILLLGTDITYADGQKRVSGAVRSDTMMVIGVGPAGSHLDVVSIPRDTRVLIRGHWDKVNAAFHLGGPKLASEVVSNLLGVPIQHWAQVNTGGLEKLVDVMGGVRLYVDRDMRYVDRTAGLRIDFKRGWHQMDGANAHRFVRFRHDELGDIGRVQRQQQFMKAVADRVLAPDILLRAPRMISTVKDNVQTNLTGPELLQLATWGASLDRQEIRLVMLPGSFSGKEYGTSYWLADAVRAKQLGRRLMGSETVANQKGLVRRALSVTVMNGTKRVGLAEAAARELRAAGWTVRSAGDSSLRSVQRTRVIAQTGHSSLAPMVGRDLGIKTERVDASVGDITTDFTVLLGEDYAGEVGLASAKNR